MQIATLFTTPDNPLPGGAHPGFLEAAPEVRLRYVRWDCPVKPFKGTVLILQGRSEFIEKYFETVSDLLERGFGVVTFDWRGQGGSSRLLRDQYKGHVENFNQYLDDLEAIFTRVLLPDCKPPFFVLAHSMGGLISLLAAPALTNRVSRMILTAPLLGLNNLPVRQGTLQKLLGLATFFGLGHYYIMRKWSLEKRSTFLSNKLTSDPMRFARNARIFNEFPLLAIGPPTIAWVFAACRTMTRVTSPEFFNSISIPTLLLAGGSDAVVLLSAIETFGRNMRSGSFATITGSKHELLQESDQYRKQVIAAFDAFIPGRTD